MKKPQPSGLLPVFSPFIPNMGPGITIWKDPKDEPRLFWMHIDPRSEEKPHGSFALSCHKYCRFHMSRPHLHCAVCRIRRVTHSKTPDLIHVYFYVLAVQEQSGIKKFLVKKILSIAEFLVLLING